MLWFLNYLARLTLFLGICLACTLPSQAQYSYENINLFANWDTVKTLSEPQYKIRYSSVWGWAGADKREYAIIGATDGTYIIEVTNPAKPVVRDYVAGRRSQCIWREYKTYKNYLYAVSDDALPNSLQIIDMSFLPDSVHVLYDQDTLAPRSHTIFIDEPNAIMYLNSTFLPKHGGHSNMAIFSLANPTSPSLLRRLEQDYPSNDNVHDCYVRNDTCYASSSYSGLIIYKRTLNNTFAQLGIISGYEPGGAYNHNSALTHDSKTLIFTDEVPAGLPLKSLNVKDFSNLSINQRFRSYTNSTATPHNAFIPAGSNTRAVVAYYQDGLQIFDITNPANPIRTGYFDTAPDNCPTCPNPSYSGCWGAYVDLPSGTILASDMQRGLFVFDAQSAMLNTTNHVKENWIQVFPNPFSNYVQISTNLNTSQKIVCEITNMIGQVMMRTDINSLSGKNTYTIHGKNLPSGTYYLHLKSSEYSITKKLIKINL